MSIPGYKTTLYYNSENHNLNNRTSALQMQTVNDSETPTSAFKTTRYQNPTDAYLNNHGRENIIYNIKVTVAIS
jgi:hypothetical protein